MAKSEARIPLPENSAIGINSRRSKRGAREKRMSVGMPAPQSLVAALCHERPYKRLRHHTARRLSRPAGSEPAEPPRSAPACCCIGTRGFGPREPGSGEPALVAKPLRGLELRHIEQMPERLKAVALGDLRQLPRSLGDEGHGLVWTAAAIEIRARRIIPRTPAPPAARDFAQNPSRILPSDRIIPQLQGGKLQLSGHVFLRVLSLFNIWRFDRGGPTTHVRIESAGRESRGTGL